ncbi:hypothetical protein T06_4874 [Trichinella sp. T6]|nr:hypothetical protein T06_4874 [Trichinella sp. T6]
MVVPFSQGTATSRMCAVLSLTNTKSGLYTASSDLMAGSTCTAKPSLFARSPTRLTIFLCLWMIVACVVGHFCEM